MNISRSKFMIGAVSAFAILGALALLVASHTTVGVIAFNYGETSVVAEVQSDALDKVAVAEKAKAEMTIADNKLYIEKTQTDKVISDSFVESHKQVEKYVAIKKSTLAKDNDSDITAELELDASMFKRFDQTRDSYELAANSLFSNDNASVGSGQTSFNRQGSIDIACSSITRAVVEVDQFICSACVRSETQTIKT